MSHKRKHHEASDGEDSQSQNSDNTVKDMRMIWNKYEGEQLNCTVIHDSVKDRYSCKKGGILDSSNEGLTGMIGSSTNPIRQAMVKDIETKEERIGFKLKVKKGEDRPKDKNGKVIESRPSYECIGVMQTPKEFDDHLLRCRDTLFEANKKVKGGREYNKFYPNPAGNRFKTSFSGPWPGKKIQDDNGATKFTLVNADGTHVARTHKEWVTDFNDPKKPVEYWGLFGQKTYHSVLKKEDDPDEKISGLWFRPMSILYRFCDEFATLESDDEQQSKRARTTDTMDLM